MIFIFLTIIPLLIIVLFLGLLNLSIKRSNKMSKKEAISCARRSNRLMQLRVLLQIMLVAIVVVSIMIKA